jgi:2-iminobutanoate/2-iminopropanoate deaminase
MKRLRISTEKAPAALGPYSQAIVAAGFVFCSGTVSIDPDTGLLPAGVAEQTEQALSNLAAILDGIFDRSARQDHHLLPKR